MAIILNKIKAKINHSRHEYNNHFFDYQMNFFYLELLDNKKSFFSYPFFGTSLFSLIRWNNKDHLINENNLKDYLLKNNIHKKITSIKILTQLRILNFVFNPVSFYILTTNEDTQYAIIEINNTFKETKLIFVDKESFKKKNNFYITIKKNFYISPFIASDEFMSFSYQEENHHLAIKVNTFNKNKTILSTTFEGVKDRYDFFTEPLIYLTSPFQGLMVVFLIHFHAFILWLKKTPYLKKSFHPEKQFGFYKNNQYQGESHG